LQGAFLFHCTALLAEHYLMRNYSSCLPDWALDLPQHFPFLFPFATRYNFLQSTSFGYARLILKWQSQQARVQDNSRRDEGIGFLGRLQRQKVRISRKHILESAVKVFELYGSSSSVLEVEYFEEVGTGLGPTLEFYSLVSKEFARKDLKIWRDGDAAGTSPYVDHPSGLYPAPISSEDIVSDGGQYVLVVFIFSPSHSPLQQTHPHFPSDWPICGQGDA
jgi:E3 ubiquitin-protein ligase TRIP12